MSTTQRAKFRAVRGVCDPDSTMMMSGQGQEGYEETVREDFEAVIGPDSGTQDRINTQAAFLIVMLLNMDISTEDKAVDTIEGLLGRLEFEAQEHHKAIHERLGRTHVHAKPGLSVPVALGVRGSERFGVGDARRSGLKDTL